MKYGDRVYVLEGKFKGQFGVYDDDEGDKIIVYLDEMTNYVVMSRSKVKAVTSGFSKKIKEEMEMRAYYAGVRTGIEMYAWWKDGIQYVGSQTRTLTEALKLINILEKGALGKDDEQKCD